VSTTCDDGDEWRTVQLFPDFFSWPLLTSRNRHADLLLMLWSVFKRRLYTLCEMKFPMTTGMRSGLKLRRRKKEVEIRAYIGYSKSKPAFEGVGTRKHFATAEYHHGRMAPLRSKSVTRVDRSSTQLSRCLSSPMNTNFWRQCWKR
jgi:hypothetical protein